MALDFSELERMIRRDREIGGYMRNPKDACAASAERVLVPLAAMGLCKQGAVAVIGLFMWSGNLYGAETHYAVAVCDPNDGPFDVRRAFIIDPTFGQFGIGSALFCFYSNWICAIRNNTVLSRKLVKSKIYSSLEAACRISSAWVCASDFEGEIVVDQLWGNQRPAHGSPKKAQSRSFGDIFEH